MPFSLPHQNHMAKTNVNILFPGTGELSNDGGRKVEIQWGDDRMTYYADHFKFLFLSPLSLS